MSVVNIDPLEALIIDETALARDEIADALAAYLRFTRNGELIPNAAFKELTSRDRVLCVLVAYRAQNLLGLRALAGGTPKEIINASGMPPGTVRPKLSQLMRERLITKSGDAYVVPTHAVRGVIEILRQESRAEP